jgi:hypothetical protein
MTGWIYAISGGLLLVGLYHIVFPVPDESVTRMIIHSAMGVIGSIGLSAVAICQRLDALRPPSPPPAAPKEPAQPPPTGGNASS